MTYSVVPVPCPSHWLSGMHIELFISGWIKRPQCSTDCTERVQVWGTTLYPIFIIDYLIFFLYSVVRIDQSWWNRSNYDESIFRFIKSWKRNIDVKSEDVWSRISSWLNNIISRWRRLRPFAASNEPSGNSMHSGLIKFAIEIIWLQWPIVDKHLLIEFSLAGSWSHLLYSTCWQRWQLNGADTLISSFKIELKIEFHLFISLVCTAICHCCQLLDWNSQSINNSKKFEKICPGGRVVSAADWHAGYLEFDPRTSQIFFRRNRIIFNMK